eukprot:2722595-Pleurochrysis_carterae.AAC.1
MRPLASAHVCLSVDSSSLRPCTVSHALTTPRTTIHARLARPRPTPSRTVLPHFSTARAGDHARCVCARRPRVWLRPRRGLVPRARREGTR